ncbi:MAG: peroxiredoxin [Nitrososphaerales archaeon]
MPRRLVVGDEAPDFTLPSQSGELVNLKEKLRKNDVVLYFYPKDNTPGCTTEARAFRDSYEVFRDIGAEVMGVSSDSVESHRGFATKCDLPFTLLSDAGGKVRKLYSVPSTFGVLPGRVTYIIDERGIVRHIFSSQMNPGKHVDEAVRVLKSIRDQEKKENWGDPAPPSQGA